MLQSTAVTLPVKNLGISKNYPTDDAIKLLIEGLSSNLNASKKQKNIAVTHNAYTDFCLALLFCVTGHRAINDPFESKNLFDLETGTLLISDKVTDASRAWRLVALSEIGVAQISAYDAYLTRLAACLSDVPDNQELVAQIVGLTRGYEPIPYFFYIDENQSGRIRSITVAELNKRWSEYWPMPIGMLRHIAATELKHESGRTDWVEIQLGHSNNLSHVFGKSSTLPVLETLKKIGESTDQYMHKLGWEHKNSPLKMPNISLISIVIKQKKNMKIGSKKRAKVREEAEQRRSVLVRKIIDQELQQQHILPTPAQFNKIIEALITAAAQEQSHANSYLKLFYRYIGMQRGGKDLLRKVPQVRQLEQESSPFNERSQADYQELLRTRSMFLAMLEEKGRSENAFELEERVSEIIFSAALFGGLANTERLERLQTALIKRTFQLQGQLFIDIPLLDSEPAPVFRWFPDTLSNLLIVGLYRSKLTDRKVSLETLNSHIKKIADQLNINVKNILTTLAALSSTALLFEVPGYIRSYLMGEIAAVSISLAAFVRVITDTALVTEPAAKKQMDVDENWSPAIRLQTKTPTANEGRQFIKLLRKIFTNSKSVENSGNKLLSRKIKDSLVKNLKKEFGSSTNLTSLHAAIISWAVYLCQSGTRFTASLKYRTIDNYVFLITNSLVPNITQDDFLSLDESGFEQIYLRTIESADTCRRLSIASRLKEFHDFLINNYEADDIEWSAIFAAAGVFVEPTFSNANFISENEYYDILLTINSDTSLSKQLSTQYAMLIVLGYRFGLRFGEALRLQYRDVQYNQEDFYLWIHNSIFGETKSAAGVRIIMLFEDLSDIEKTIVQSSLDYAAESFLEDSQAAVVTQNIESRGLIDRYSAANYISIKLKMVTGDSSIRFHHLRHAWATRIFTLLNKNIYPSQFNQFTPKDYNNKQLEKFLGASKEKHLLRSIMTAIGHNRESTTLASYIHTIDQISVAAIDKASTINLNNFIQSYALKRSSADIRKRKSRDLKNNIDVSIPFPNIETKPRELNGKHTISSFTEKPSLNKIDLLLRSFSNTQQNISKIANRLFINSDQAKKIIETATSTERDSGFTCYKLYRKSNDPIVKSSELKQDSDLLKAENIRIQEIFKKLDTDLNKLSIDEISIIESCLKVWIKTNEKSGVNIVSDYSELKLLIHGLSILNLDLKMSIMIKNNTGNHLISDLNKLNIPIQVVNQLPASTEKTAVRRTGRVGLKIESNKSVGPRRTLLRILTVINIWFSC
jgi:integrase